MFKVLPLKILLYTLQCGHNDVILLLSCKECNSNAQNREGDTPLHIAAKYGQVHTIVQLLSCREYDPNAQNKKGDTPLHITIKGGPPLHNASIKNIQSPSLLSGIF